MPAVMTSALYNRGIDTLKDMIVKRFVRNGSESNGGRIVPNLRHKLALEHGIQAAECALNGFEKNLPTELIAIDLKEAVDVLGEIVGLAAREEVLDEIFNRFCIGK